MPEALPAQVAERNARHVLVWPLQSLYLALAVTDTSSKAHPNFSPYAQVWAQAANFLVQIRGLQPLRVSFWVRPARCLFCPRDNGRAI